MQPQKQDQLCDMSTGFNIALMLLFSVNRTVQIWSRVPGTTGTWFLGLYFFFGGMLQTWYCGVNEQASMRTDSIPPCFVLGLSIIWFAVHGIVRGYQFLQGTRFHSYEPGQGVLAPFLPSWQSDSVGFASDAVTAVGLSLAFALFASPGLSGWYASMCFWLIVAQLWSHARDRRMQQARIDAQVEAEQWSNSQRL